MDVGRTSAEVRRMPTCTGRGADEQNRRAEDVGKRRRAYDSIVVGGTSRLRFGVAGEAKAQVPVFFL